MKKFAFFIFICVFALAQFACDLTVLSSKDDESSPVEDSLYLPSNEEIAFGMEQLKSMENDSEAEDDLEDVESVIADDTELSTAIMPYPAKKYAVRIIWGKIRGVPRLENSVESVDEMSACDSDATEAGGWINWEGGAYVSQGGINLNKTILFDQGQDYIKERVSYKALEWVSLTKPHYDGVLLRVTHYPYISEVEVAEPGVTESILIDQPLETIAKELIQKTGPAEGSDFYVTSEENTDIEIEDDNSVSPVRPYFIFRTKPFSIRIPIRKLANFNGIFPIDRCGNAVSIQATEIIPGCQYGYLKGVWEGIDKIFYGVWQSSNGKITGYLKGEYGNGDFHGKYISETGQFKGFLKGNYTDIPSFPGGVFRGDWVDANGFLFGKIGGHYHFLPHTNAADVVPNGFFHGRWCRICPLLESDEE